MTFNADSYWRSMGGWLAGPGAATPEHEMTEEIIANLLSGLAPFDDVLDIGCGRGRLASLLLEVLPSTAYSGVDIGEEQVSATSKVRPDGEVFLSRFQDFYPHRKWDLVLASEVLMHIPPDDIWAACDKVKSLARRWIVTVDWTEPVPEPIAEWNWLYDYADLFGSENIERSIPAGLQTVFLIRP